MFKDKGAFFIVHAFVFLLVIVICYLILLLLPNILYMWKGSTQIPIIGGSLLPPATVVVVIEPLYLPLVGDHTLFSLLHSAENTTGVEIQELLADAVYYNTDVLTIEGNNINVKEVVKNRMIFLLPQRDLAYNIAVVSGGSTIFSVGTRDFETKYFSSTTLTLPDLRKVEVYFYMG